MVAEEYKRLHEEVAAYCSAAFADNTKKTYRCHLNAYLTFCNKMAVPPVPASHTLISMYAAYLARRLKARSVRQYINVVRLLHLESGYMITLALAIGNSSPRLKELNARLDCQSHEKPLSIHPFSYKFRKPSLEQCTGL